MKHNIDREIEDLVLSFRQLPYLFIGTGFSMRYSTAPSWNDLLMNIWKILNDGDELKFKKFVQQISYKIELDKKGILDGEQRKYYLNPQLATEIQKQFNDKFYSDDDFENKMFSKEEVDELINSGYDPFKFYVSKQTNNLKVMDESVRGECKELEYLKNNENKIAGIITTNYDSILETIFQDFDVLIGQDNMLTSNTNNLFEIFKIHGSADNPNSIVITQGDYDYFMNKLKYLSAKLLTLFVEHPIVFIGYGVGDLNIRAILQEIAECLNKEQLEEIKNNFIFINPAFGGEEKVTSKEIDFGDKRIIMTEITIEDFTVLFKSLSSIKSSMPIKLIRKMQDMICNFIATTEATNNIMVGSINNSNISDEQLGIYFGDINVVSSMGFDYYGIDDIIDDVLNDNKPYLMNEKLISNTFRNIRSIAGKTYLPVYKYINGLGISIDKLPADWNIIKSMSSISLTRTEEGYTKDKINYKSIKEIQQAYSNHLPKQLAYIKLNLKNFSDEELGDYLKIMFKDQTCLQKYKSNLKQLAAAYDYLKYGKKKKV